MRRSGVLQRGAKGYGWWKKFSDVGADQFQRRYVPPTPFDWTAKQQDGSIIQRPYAFFDIRIETEKLGRMKFELATDVVPKTCENFKALCLGTGIKFGGYQGTKIHYIQKGNCMMGGDVETPNSNGTGNHSAGSSRYITDENFIIPHTGRGLLSMASIGVHTNGSQFYLSLSPMKHLNGRCVTFGRMVEGEESLQAMEKVFTFRGAPARAITIDACGIIDEIGKEHFSKPVTRSEESLPEEIRKAA